MFLLGFDTAQPDGCAKKDGLNVFNPDGIVIPNN